ncbi:uncharacterized protein LOC126203197 [Schistocerca nitens]|uniref:uncharacterized protein LOC126203197 n=1 Tax=Schistocerca nitens TaxID=7011 RepID=UPI0021178CB9|nr:uncharacterized protein LOC126203197 [Schistocerca nitens]
MQYFKDFKKIMYSKTKDEATDNYNAAKANICDEHNSYQTYLDGYWERRHLWALPYRTRMLIQGHHTNNYSEAFMRILKDYIFERRKAVNVVHMVDIILTRVNSYFEMKLLDAANRASLKSFHETIRVPTPEILSKIMMIQEGFLLVPSESIENRFYVVNMAVLVCNCLEGNTGKRCKHIDWASIVYRSEKYEKAVNSEEIRRKYYFIATGKQPPQNWLEPLHGPQNTATLNDADVEHIDTEEERDNVLQISIDNTEERLDADVGQMDAQEEKRDVEEEIPDTTHLKNISHKTNINLLNRAVAHLTELSSRSPEEMTKSFEAFLLQVEKKKTPSACASMLLTLGEGKARHNMRKRIPIQSTSIGRRKKVVKRKNAHTQKF